MPLPDVVTTEHLRLYRPKSADLAPIRALFARAGSECYGCEALVRPSGNPHAALDAWIAAWEEHGFGYWVARNDAGEFVGVGGLVASARDAAMVEFGARIAPRAWRQAYVPEIVEAALRVARESLRLERIDFTIDPSDTGAIALAARFGFVAEDATPATRAVRYVARLGPASRNR